MIVSPGEKVYVIFRRLFETEIRRHFVGEIMEVTGSTVRLEGNAIIFDSTKNQYSRKPELRTTIVDLAESGYIVNFIPSKVNIRDLQYILNQNKRLVVTDGKDFSLDINEFGAAR